MSKQPITFIVNTDRDQDILRWLGRQDNKSAAIRDAIRAHLSGSDITLTDVYEAIQDLKRGGWGPASQAHSSVATHDNEPPDVAATLDSLGL